MTATFFGHSRVLSDVQPLLETVLRDLIETRGVTLFYVGNNGEFDAIVQRTLEQIKRDDPRIDYAVVLAYLPAHRLKRDATDYAKTVFPDCLDSVPPRYAIDKRNRWMIRQAEIVVTYVTSPFGGAAKFKTIAERGGREVINLADMLQKRK